MAKIFSIHPPIQQGDTLDKSSRDQTRSGVLQGGMAASRFLYECSYFKIPFWKIKNKK